MAPVSHLAGSTSTTPSNIGINYGQLGRNLPTPEQARELVLSTIISKVKIYDTNPAIIKAFANTGIQLVVTVLNKDIRSLFDAKAAAKWVDDNVACYVPATQITTILVGNEILQGRDAKLGDWLVPVMVNIHGALQRLGLDSNIKVSTPHSMLVLSNSLIPSSGAFRPELDHIMRPMLHFLSSTASPFVVNTHPFLAHNKGEPFRVSVDYALFMSDSGVLDPVTNVLYCNLMDDQVDAVYTAMAKLGYQDIDVVIGETGWPSAGDSPSDSATMNNAMLYNRNLIRHVTSTGPPMRPKLIDTYISSLFNENLKPGPTTERNFGLFKPDMTPVYNIDMLKTGC